MWRNYENRKNEQSVKSVYLIKGLNLDRFINAVQRRGIALFDIKKLKDKRMLVTVNFSDSEKFFAIAKEMCYNIKKIRYKGKGYPIFYLLKNFGLVIGVAVFIAVAVFFNDVVFEISFNGNGSVYGREVKEYLQTLGIKEYSRFSDIDVKGLGDKILKNNNHLSFATCKKNGNRLEIELILSKDNVDSLKGNVYELKADVDGVIEKMKVYRGTALFSEGDSVRKGDLLVGGYVIIKEQTVEVNILAWVTIVTQEKFVFYSDKKGMESVAQALAEQELGDKEVVKSNTTVRKIKDKYEYTTVLSFRRVYFSG